MKRLFFILGCLCCLQLSASNSRAAQASSNVVGAYYENWSQYRPGVGGRPQFFPNMIDPTIITDLYYAFAIFGFVTKSIDPNNPHLTGNFQIQPVEWNDQSVLYPQVQALKQINPNLRTILSIGGWSFNDPNDPNIGAYTYQLFSQMVSSSTSRAEFINSAIAYAQQYGFNGIDIDWEYPGDLTRGGSIYDFVNFVQFVKECKAAFEAANPPLLLTYASAAVVPTGVPQSYHDNPASYYGWLAQCSKYLDRLNVMAYDYHGPFDVPKLTGVNAPLNRDTDPNGIMYVANTVQNYLSNGVPPQKIVLGMPIYGHSYAGVTGLSSSDYGPGKPFTSAGPAGPATGSPGLLAYFEIADMIALNQLVFGTDSITSTALGYNLSTTEWVSFDTPDTINLKMRLAVSNELLGVMFWAIDDDEYYWGTKYPNIRAAQLLMYRPYRYAQLSYEDAKCSRCKPKKKASSYSAEESHLCKE